MFKRVFQSITKALGPSAKIADPPPAAPPAAPTPAPRAPSVEKEMVRESVQPAPVAQARPKNLEVPRFRAVPNALPKPAEEMCGLTSGMSKDQIRERLAFLYRRYNRATSSLNANLRDEAEMMLDAVVQAREKHFGPI